MGRNSVFERGLKKPAGGGRRSPEGFLLENGFPPPGQSRLPSSVSRALREACNIQHKGYVLIYVDTHGRIQFDASPAMEPLLDDLFTADVRQRLLQGFEGKLRGRRLALSGTPHDIFQTIQEDELQSTDRRRSSDTSSMDVRQPPHKAATRKKQTSPKPKGRPVKRRKSSAKTQGPSQWGAQSDGNSSDEGDYEDVEINIEALKIGDTAAVGEYFERQFKRIQQLNCKVIAKAWIKVVEPKKQSNHPYNGGKPDPGGKADPEKTKPDWWPAGLRHKEPDHVKKDERVALLMHILRGLRDRGITVDQLQAATNDVIGQLQPESRPMLAELYRVARFEERYLRNEIDSDTEVQVSVAERISMSARGPKSSGDSEEMDLPQISSPEVHVSHSSLQETGTSSLVQPVGLLALHDTRQYRGPDRRREIPPSNVINHPFSAGANVLGGQHRPMLSSDYQPQYNQQSAASEMQSYMDTQSPNDAQSLDFMTRSVPHSFAAPSPDHMVLRDRSHYTTLQQPQQQPPLNYSSWSPSPFQHASFSNQVSYADTPTSGHTALQTHPPQAHYQLPLPANNVGGLPPRISHQSELSYSRLHPQYDLRTGPHGLPHSHHPPLHPDFSGYSLEDKSYVERS